MSSQVPTNPEDYEQTIRLLHDELSQTNHDVAALTLELEKHLDALRVEVQQRITAQNSAQAQLQRLNLLQQITHAIAQRQDLRSIFQVVIRHLEDSLPIDFGCVCVYHPTNQILTLESVGARSAELARELSLPEHSLIAFEGNELGRALSGEFVYVADSKQLSFPFAQRLREGALSSLIIAPLIVESNVFGVLIAARKPLDGFAAEDREFLQQLSEHVALAAHQTQLYSALQRAYEDLRQSQQTTMQQERLRALGEMASGIAHDINNALSPVGLYTETLLERESGISEKGREYLRTMQRALGDVANTISRMRDFYRERESQLELAEVDLSDCAQQVIELTRVRWRDMAQKQGIMIDMHAELADALPSVMGVENEIRDALTNMVFNAIDAMPRGGRLTVRTQVVKEAVQNVTEAPISHVSIEVIDTGTGMDEETLRRCREPFFTTKGNRGTGLGLAMVYGMARRHNAELEIESAEGQGTTIRLIFPAGVQQQATGSLSTSNQAPMQRLRLLVIDDDPLLIQSLRDILEADGHVVTVADGGQAGIDAFQLAQHRGEPFSVVITDLGMPYVDGRKVASAIRNVSASTPIIMLTGWGQRLISDNEKPSEVQRVLSKPPKLHELRAALRELTVAHESRPVVK